MTEENYISLIIKKLSKEISKEDLSSLNNWISLNQENKELYDSMLNNWRKAELYKSRYKANKKLAWQKIQDNFKDEIEKETKVISFNYKRIAKIAATLLVLLALSFITKSYFLSNNIEIQTANNETKDLILPDGTKVFLNENSSISYASKFVKRNVTLNGEAFFEVTKDKEHPFIISSGETETQVLGTSFNLKNNNENVQVILLSGKLKFSNKHNNSVILLPGDIATYNNETDTFTKENLSIENDTYWKTKKLIFENTKISDVVISLENFYNVDIEINSKNYDCPFTGKFENSNIEEDLKVISYSLNTTFNKKGNTYILQEGLCD